MPGKYVYTLYDHQELPVLVTDNLQELGNYLGRKELRYLSVQIWKFFNKKKQGKTPELISSDGKRYTIYRFKES